MIPFDVDTRAGFAHALEQVTAGFSELFDIDESLLRQYDLDTLKQLPTGASALYAIMYSLVGFLLEEEDELALELLDLAAKGMQPAIIKHIGIKQVLDMPVLDGGN